MSESIYDMLSKVRCEVAFMTTAIVHMGDSDGGDLLGNEEINVGFQEIMYAIEDEIKRILKFIGSEEFGRAECMVSCIDESKQILAEVQEGGIFTNPSKELEQTVKELDSAISKSEQLKAEAENLKKECMAHL